MRTIIIPADPIPTVNPRPENFTDTNNPISGDGSDPTWLTSQLLTYPGGTTAYGSLIGSMENIPAAFSGGSNKKLVDCAKCLSTFGFFNWVGVNWAAEASGQEAPQLTHIAASFTATAPNDSPFLSSGATGWQFQGSANGLVWVTLSQGTTGGTAGEILTMTLPSGILYQYHRFVLNGDGMNPIGVAQLTISIGDSYPVDGV